MPIDAAFMREAQAAFNPYSPGSGTEHVAFLLYSLVRMTRPRTLLEYGSGYTTLFLLAALADNLSDVEEERASLLTRVEALGDVGSGEISVDDARVAEWFNTEGKTCGIDPAQYLVPYSPRLYSFERHDAEHPYAARLRTAVARLGLDAWFTQIAGQGPAFETVPEDNRPVDLAWNDDMHYREFFLQIWPMLNPRGGLLIFHNTVATERAWSAIEWMRTERARAGDLEVLTLQEPHKLNQNSCTILRRTSQFQPRHLTEAIMPEVLDSLIRFGRASIRRDD
jgi:predicted O-methyltransferase YrrM